MARPHPEKASTAGNGGTAGATDPPTSGADTDVTVPATSSDDDVLGREVERLQERYRRERADEVIAALHERAEAIKTRQVSTALDRFEAAGADRESRRDVVEPLADAMVANLLAAPILRLRAAADEGDLSTLETATRLFESGSETEALDTR